MESRLLEKLWEKNYLVLPTPKGARFRISNYAAECFEPAGNPKYCYDQIATLTFIDIKLNEEMD